jgi:hypothetical protein
MKNWLLMGAAEALNYFTSRRITPAVSPSFSVVEVMIPSWRLVVLVSGVMIILFWEINVGMQTLDDG